MRLSLSVVPILLFAVPLAAEETKTWQGTWRNLRYGTSGPLRCTATTADGKTYKATFDGMFRRSKFSFKANFAARKGRGQTNIGGTAVVEGDRYQWTGYIRGNTLYGRFRSQKGYFGFFQLKQVGR